MEFFLVTIFSINSAHSNKLGSKVKFSYLNNNFDFSIFFIKHIAYSSNKFLVFQFIQKTLDFGKVITQFVNTSRDVIQNKRKRNISISILNGNIVLPSKQKKFDNFIKAFNS